LNYEYKEPGDGGILEMKTEKHYFKYDDGRVFKLWLGGPLMDDAADFDHVWLTDFDGVKVELVARSAITEITYDEFIESAVAHDIVMDIHRSN
jgi:hypothetical protein